MSSTSQFKLTLCYHKFCNVIKKQKNLKRKKNNTLYTNKQPLIMIYEKSKRARDNFSKFIYQFQPKIKTLVRKIVRILIKLYRQNMSIKKLTSSYFVMVSTGNEKKNGSNLKWEETPSLPCPAQFWLYSLSPFWIWRSPVKLGVGELLIHISSLSRMQINL